MPTITPLELIPPTVPGNATWKDVAETSYLKLNLITRKLNEIITVLNDLDGRVDDLEELP